MSKNPPQVQLSFAVQVPARVPTAADFELCHECGAERVYHAPGRCSCKKSCTCRGFVGAELAAQRRRDRLDRDREWASDARG